MSCCGLTSLGAIPQFVLCFSVHWWGTRRIARPILWRRNWKSALQSFKSGQKCLTIFCVTVCDFYCIDKRNVMLLKRTYFWLFPSFSSRTVVFRAVNICSLKLQATGTWKTRLCVTHFILFSVPCFFVIIKYSQTYG